MQGVVERATAMTTVTTCTSPQPVDIPRAASREKREERTNHHGRALRCDLFATRYYIYRTRAKHHGITLDGVWFFFFYFLVGRKKGKNNQNANNNSKHGSYLTIILALRTNDDLAQFKAITVVGETAAAADAKHSVERHTTVRAPTTINATSGDRMWAQRRAAGVAGVPRGGGDSPGPPPPRPPHPPVYRWQHRGLRHRRRRRRRLEVHATAAEVVLIYRRCRRRRRWRRHG